MLNSKQFIGLKVETKSGEHLGHIRDFDIDNTLQIQKIYIKPQGIVKGLVENDLVISKDLVLSIDDQKMVVEDLEEKEAIKEMEENKMPANEFPVAASNIEL
jgi:sporulation protein YlmC with PRC-barrel domain